MPEDRKDRRMAGNVWTGLSWVERSWLALAGLISIGVMYGLTQMVGWPSSPGNMGSLLSGHGAWAGWIVAILGLGICTVTASLIVHHVEFEAGLLCAAGALGMLAVRGGGMGQLLRTSGPVYGSLAVEILLLGAILGAAWMILDFAHGQGLLAPELSAVETENEATLQQKLSATAIAVVVVVIAMSVLMQSSAKKQAMWAVGLSSLAGALAAHQAIPVRPSFWYWSAPIIAGFAGYVWAFFSPGDYLIGMPANALVGATPLDYASAGVVGAITGYWMSRRWHANKGLEGETG